VGTEAVGTDAVAADRHPVDQMLPAGQLFLYGLQHVMSMYAGVVAVPLIVGNALGLPFPDLAYLGALAVELGLASLLLIGYRTRPVALAMAAFTLVTALVFHHNFADQNQLIHFLKNVAIAGGLLQVAAFGAGALSVDGRRSVRAARRV